MSWITRTLGLTLKVPSDGLKNWSSQFITDFVDKISAHDHSGSPDGVQIQTAAIANGAVTVGKLAAGLGATVGDIKMWPVATPPSGWLICDGTAVNRITYADLFALIGEDWGVGDGVNTFNLPNFVNFSPMGAGSTVAKAASAGATTHSHTGPSHTHTGPSHTHAGPSHTHTGPSHTHSVPAHYHGMGTGADINITSSGTHNHGVHTKNTLGGTGDTGGFAAKGKDGTSDCVDAGTSTTGAHTHAVGNFSGRIGLVTGGVDGNSAMTRGTTNPPFLAVNYGIKL